MPVSKPTASRSHGGEIVDSLPHTSTSRSRTPSLPAFVALSGLGLLVACSQPPYDYRGWACPCTDGYVCHYQRQKCVPVIPIGCDEGQYCPSAIGTGASCTVEESFVPCVNGMQDCQLGCRTCENGLWTACSGGERDIPVTPFDFVDVEKAEVGTQYTAATMVSGFDGTLTAIVSGGGAAIRNGSDGTAWTDMVTMKKGQTLEVHMLSSVSESTAMTASVVLGAGSADWTITTKDLTPDLFDFVDQTDVPISTLCQASALVSRFDGPLTASVVGDGSVEIRNQTTMSAWSTTATVNDGEVIDIQMTSAPTSLTTQTATVSLGPVNADWNVTTEPDTLPDVFDFADETQAYPSQQYVTNAVVTGFDGPLMASVAGADASIHNLTTGSAWGTRAAMSPGESLEIRMTASVDDLTAVSALVTLGTGSADWEITTRDTTPDPFGFADVTKAELSWLYLEQATVTGFDGPLVASVSGGDAAIGNLTTMSAFGATASMNPDEILGIQMTSSANDNTPVTAVVTLGRQTVGWVVTTKDLTPDAFDFTDVTSADPNEPRNDQATVTGFDGPLVASVTGGGGVEISNGTVPSAWGASASLNAGDLLEIRLTSSATSGASVTAAVTLGLRTVDWVVRTYDFTPDAMAFTAINPAKVSIEYMTNLVVTGFERTLPVTVSGGGASIRNATWGSAWGGAATMRAGDALSVLMTSSSANAAKVTATVTMGSAVANWDIVTAAATGNLTDGFLVLTSASFNGNLGGLSGANAKCLADLLAFDWKNKTSAFVDATTVKALVCDGTTCNNLLPNSEYRYARSNSPNDGGGSFLTGANGTGPNENTNWSTSMRFGVTASVWTGRAAGSGSAWATTSGVNHCRGWTWGTSDLGANGNTNYTDSARWALATANCTSSARLICFIDPTPEGVTSCGPRCSTGFEPGIGRYVAPAGARAVDVEAYGAGGGGGGSSGGGGGGGGTLVRRQDATVITVAGGGGGGGGNWGGGGGGYARTVATVAAGETLESLVGGGGYMGCSSLGGEGGRIAGSAGQATMTPATSSYGGGGGTANGTGGSSTHGGGGGTANGTGGGSTHGGGGGTVNGSPGTSVTGANGTVSGGGGGGGLGSLVTVGGAGTGSAGGTAANGGPGDGIDGAACGTLAGDGAVLFSERYGYFVLTATAWNGNLGDLAGADAKCLAELLAQDWMGKADATKSAQTVKAFLCSGSACNTPMDSARYFFAKAGAPAVGGASFIADTQGQGPSDAGDWSGATFFGEATDYWSGRQTLAPEVWANTAAAETCQSWAAGTALYQGVVGTSAATNAARWNNGTPPTCETTKKLICMVHPQ
jgi:hypothetical protein